MIRWEVRVKPHGNRPKTLDKRIYVITIIKIKLKKKEYEDPALYKYELNIRQKLWIDWTTEFLYPESDNWLTIPLSVKTEINNTIGVVNKKKELKPPKTVVITNCSNGLWQNTQ